MIILVVTITTFYEKNHLQMVCCYRNSTIINNVDAYTCDCKVKMISLKSLKDSNYLIRIYLIIVIE